MLQVAPKASSRPQGETYTVWLARSPSASRCALTRRSVDDRARSAAQFPIPVEVLAYLASETFDQIDVSLHRRRAQLRSRGGEGADGRRERPPEYTGDRVLSGDVIGPVAGVEHADSRRAG